MQYNNINNYQQKQSNDQYKSVQPRNKIKPRNESVQPYSLQSVQRKSVQPRSNKNVQPIISNDLFKEENKQNTKSKQYTKKVKKWILKTKKRNLKKHMN